MNLYIDDILVYDSNINGYPDTDHDEIFFKKYNITPGRCHGLDGQVYGIPTKDDNLNILPLNRIAKYIKNFIEDASVYPEKRFLVTKIGCGLANYTPEQIAPLFKEAIELDNIPLPEEFWQILGE